MTVSLIATLTARPETREELFRLLVNQVGPTRAEHGCIDYNLHIDAADPCVFVFYENWKRQADLDAHMETDHLEPLMSRIDRLLTTDRRPAPSSNCEIGFRARINRRAKRQ